jgi:acetylglutamate kinase
VYCFEKKGVLADPADDSSVIPSISHTEYIRLKEQGIVSKGMIPKLDNSFNALAAGVRSVIIGHADEIGQLAGPETNRSGTTLYPD